MELNKGLGMFGTLFGLIANKGDGESTNEILSQALSKSQNDPNKDPSVNEILNNPLEAFEKNEKLRNMVLQKQKEMGLNFLPTTNELSDDKIPTDLGLIQLDAKIHISPLENETGLANILMIGRSGCGQTTLISYLTKNKQLEGADTMFAQKFEGAAINLELGGGTVKVCINESPGMCSGFGLDELEGHWNKLIHTLNEQGGVSIFLLLIKSNERIISQLLEELEEFSELYFNDKQLFWKRTIVVFTTIDELKGCDTFEERVERIQGQMKKRGMEEMKAIIDGTGNECLYVSSIDFDDTQRFIRDLGSRINHIISENGEFIRNPNQIYYNDETQASFLLKGTNAKQVVDGNSYDYEIQITDSKVEHRKTLTNPQSPLNQKVDTLINNLEPIHQIRVEDREDIQQKEMKFTCKPPHVVNKEILSNETSDKNTMSKPIVICQYGSLEKSSTNGDFDFLQHLSRDQLILLMQETCRNKRVLKEFRASHKILFSPNKKMLSPDHTGPKRNTNWCCWKQTEITPKI